MKQEQQKAIAIFIPTLNGGGAERAMVQLAVGLVSLGHRVQLIAAKAEGVLKEIIPENIELIDCQCKRTLTGIFPLAKYLRTNAPVALFSTIPHANLIATIARMLSGTKTPVILRESNSPMSETKASLGRRFVHWLVPYVYPKADGVIAVSEGVAEQLRGMERNHGDFKIRVLATPVISPQLLEGANENLTDTWIETSDAPVILGCGRLVAAKGFDTLIRAFALVKSRRNARLVILGEGPLRKELHELITTSGLSESVYLPGFKANPFPYFKLAKIFALSSRFEGMPNVLLQALALGLPVVATDCKSGPRECLKGGQLGRLVPVDDVPTLASALEEALDGNGPVADPEAIRQEYSVTSTAAKYLHFALEGSKRQKANPQ